MLGSENATVQVVSAKAIEYAQGTNLVLAAGVLVAGILFLYGLYMFGIKLFSQYSYRMDGELPYLLQSDSGRFDPRYYVDALSNWHQNFLEKRNDFWEHYGQVALAVLIVTVLAVLLLAKAISAEAGLPILSAVAGFAIAKTNSTSSSLRQPEKRKPDEDSTKRPAPSAPLT